MRLLFELEDWLRRGYDLLGTLLGSVVLVAGLSLPILDYVSYMNIK